MRSCAFRPYCRVYPLAPAQRRASEATGIAPPRPYGPAVPTLMVPPAAVMDAPAGALVGTADPAGGSGEWNTSHS